MNAWQDRLVMSKLLTSHRYHYLVGTPLSTFISRKFYPDNVACQSTLRPSSGYASVEKVDDEKAGALSSDVVFQS